MGVPVELGFVNRGGNQDFKSSEIITNINYFNLPILVKVSPFDFFMMHLGPEFGFKTSAASTYPSETNDAKSFYNSKFDIGINAGFTYRLIDKLDLSFRFYRGFVSTSSVSYIDENGQYIDKARLFNQGVSFTLGYMIK